MNTAFFFVCMHYVSLLFLQDSNPGNSDQAYQEFKQLVASSSAEDARDSLRSRATQIVTETVTVDVKKEVKVPYKVKTVSRSCELVPQRQYYGLFRRKCRIVMVPRIIEREIEEQRFKTEQRTVQEQKTVAKTVERNFADSVDNSENGYGKTDLEFPNLPVAVGARGDLLIKSISSIIPASNYYGYSPQQGSPGGATHIIIRNDTPSDTAKGIYEIYHVEAEFSAKDLNKFPVYVAYRRFEDGRFSRKDATFDEKAREMAGKLKSSLSKSLAVDASKTN